MVAKYPGSFVLTYDLGGSHVSAGLCALDTFQVLGHAGAALDSIATFEEFIDVLHTLGSEVTSGHHDIAGASLAVPGPFDCQAGVSLMEHKLLPLYGRDMRGALAARFGWTPDQIRFLNDAAAFLLGEVHAGAASGVKRAAGLTLGTGIGSSFAIDGHTVTSGLGVPPGGEIWDFPYRGAIVEDLISTRAIKKSYLDRTGRDLEVKAIADAAAHEPAALTVFEDFGSQLGQVIHDVIAPFRPEIIVIGGGISRSSSLFLPVAQRLVAADNIHLVPSSLLDLAALAGAAAFWRDEQQSSSLSSAPVEAALLPPHS